MIDDLQSTRNIKDIPFGGIMFKADTRPVLFRCLIPGIDQVIWKLRPCVGRDPLTMELRQAALHALACAIENEGDIAGAAIYELDGFSCFAFRTVDREQMLAEMEVRELLPW